MRVGCIIDLSQPAPQKPTSVTAAVARPARITADDMQDTDVVCRVLNDLQLGIYAATQATRSQPIQAPILFRNATFNATFATNPLTLAHHFGYHANYIMVGWWGAANQYDLVTDVEKTTDDILVLRSNVAGQGNLLVF